MGNEGERRKNGKNERGSQEGGEDGTQEVPLMVESVWKSRIGKDTNKKTLGSCYRSQARLCAQKGKILPSISNKERGGPDICRKSVKEGIYSTF